jgi:NADPH:quinone reductase-like Zn-dependent oxidoreductase
MIAGNQLLPRRVASRVAGLDFESGPPEVLVVKEAPDPQPAAGETRIRVEASGGNFADLMGRSGTIVQAIFLMF